MNHKKLMVKIYQQKDQLLKQKKKDTKNLLKIEEILAQCSAITGKLIRIVSFFKHLLVGFI